ncbi:MAG TPA: NAD(P)H-dependent oxidoreductase [Isosphaeraceae bacterium]|jgi:NAD(P)H-dependent FMN reductase
MSTTPRILALAGSTRRDSFNKRLARIAARGAEAAGAEVTVLDLRDVPLPLFDEDLEREQGPPEPATRLKALLVGHDGLLVASPEYNSSITAVLKNAIDWASRPAPGEPPLVAFRGKVAALLSASPGALGGLRGLVHLRSILGNIGVVVLPDQVAVPRAFEAFAEDGSLADPKQRAAVEGLGRALAGFVARLK